MLGAYVAEARFETLRHLKAPAFALPFLIIPVALYMFFSTVAARRRPHAAQIRSCACRIRMFTGFGMWA